MGKAIAFANNFLKLLFNATPWANVADNAAVSPLTNFYASLHTADPGTTGDQTTNEIAYTSYARVPVLRTSSGWAVVNNVVNPVAAITFPMGTGGSGTATYLAIGSNVSGAGNRFYSGPITPSIVCGNGVTPSIGTASTITET